MNTRKRRAGLAPLTLGAVAAACRPAASASSVDAAKVRTVFSRVLPPMDGGRLKTTIVEVSYEPGGSSRPHSHSCAVVGYVIEGAFRTQVKGEPEAIYRAGEALYEAPNGVHQVSANASDKEPVRFIASFACDHDGPLSTPVPETDPTRAHQP